VRVDVRAERPVCVRRGSLVSKFVDGHKRSSVLGPAVDDVARRPLASDAAADRSSEMNLLLDVYSSMACDRPSRPAQPFP